ncbi:hypothetical protein EJ04DRAFT_423566 [Polyplosphaeria fusca]|uniref:Uncharacterized protein n=1 Tax=Polyplosphaeria fusca TaxID=682080 RepID=A0A9P4V996_9PLEO|nr:hypothetical protein EJ04DRAFT_423566 [Polyplosphaeria fusca]
MSTKQAVRRWVWTGAITAVTIVGAIYGAGLRSQQQFTQETKRVLEASPEEKIAQLETVRSDLVRRRNDLQRKINNFSAQRLEREQASNKPR